MPTQPPVLPDFRQEYRAAVNNAGYYGLPTSGSSMAPMRYVNMPFADFDRVARQVQAPPAPMAQTIPAYRVQTARQRMDAGRAAQSAPGWTPMLPPGFTLNSVVSAARNALIDNWGRPVQTGTAAGQTAPVSPYSQPYGAATGYMPQTAPTTQAAGQTAGQTYSGGGYSNAQSSGGIDPAWYEQFQREHGGATPEEVYYKDKGYALQHALADKAWGDWFYQAMGRPPSAEDWRVSYRQRQDDYYGSF